MMIFPVVLALIGGVLCTVSSQEIVTVRYGYFTEARPINAGCGRGWFGLATPTRIYKVECYPQTSGNFAASRLDNHQLDIACLGSAPLAQAIARGIDIKIVYVAQEAGDNEGVYVRPSSGDYVGIEDLWDIGGRTFGVPFGSTSHYQLLFLINRFEETGSVALNVTLRNLSPEGIISAWDDGTIDGAACWGECRDHILHLSTVSKGRKLVSAQTIAEWGAGTSTDVVVTRTFAREHGDFVDHFVGIMARLTDSYIDRSGFHDPRNIPLWDPAKAFALVLSVVDALMSPQETPRQPSEQARLEAVRNLALFAQATAREQISCDVLGRGPRNPCSTPPRHLTLLRQNAKFLMRLKILGKIRLLDFNDDTNCSASSTLCGVIDGGHLDQTLWNCSNCLTVGPYPVEVVPPVSSSSDRKKDELLGELEESDSIHGQGPFPLEREIGRRRGDSTCSSTETMIFSSSSATTGSFGDGANVVSGKSYSDNLNCRWVVRSADCDFSSGACSLVVQLRVSDIRVWSEDFVRIYAHTDMECKPESGVLLAQLSHVSDRLPPFRAKGCISVVFQTDSNQERLYAGSTGDGFLVEFHRGSDGCFSLGCSGRGTCLDGLCQCDEDSWGGDCSLQSHCLGTKRVRLAGSQPKVVKSAAGIDSILSIEGMAIGDNPLDPAVAYQNDLHCNFIFEATFSGTKYVAVDIIYDIEPGFDTISLESGFGATAVPYVVLSGQSSGFERYYVEVDSSGLASLQFKTDSRGRRLGFHATVWEVTKSRIDEECQNKEPGSGGNFCEFEYCVARNELSPPDGKGTLGRVISQQRTKTVRPMPWAPEGGCVWMLSGDALPSDIDVVKIRLTFNSPLDFESYLAEAVGDKVIIGLGGDNVTLFKEQCREHTDCARPWQTGVCQPQEGCEVLRVYDIEITDLTEPGFIAIITDRNDVGKDRRGLPDLELSAVRQCPREGHCLSLGGTCDDGYCTCMDGYACACSCQGDPPPRSFRDTLFLVVGISVAVLFVIIGLFWLYWRRTKKELADTIVALRCSTEDYVPRASPKVVWCWEEDEKRMYQHPNGKIYGNAENCWIKYDETAASQLEQAYQQHSTEGVTVEGTRYVVDLQAWTQTNQVTRYKRKVQRFEHGVSHRSVVDRKQSQVDEMLPSDLRKERQLVLVRGDIIQISKERNDGWAFGTKLHHVNEDYARRLLQAPLHDSANSSDELSTDTGWFPLVVTKLPTRDDLRGLQQQIGDAGFLEAPPEWDHGGDSTIARPQLLLEGDKEFEEVKKAFTFTLETNAEVKSIERIQNLALWQSYVVKRRTMCRDTSTSQSPSELRMAEERVERRWLWHGTGEAVTHKIVQQGFDRNFCGKNNTLWGKGVYFARDSSYSAQKKYSEPDSNGLQYVLACRVAVGKFCLGEKDGRAPMLRDARRNIRFDTTVNDLSYPSIYVTYHDAQAYPEYKIAFKKKDCAAEG